MRPKYIAATLNWFLTVYSSLLVTAVAMLHCVHLPGRSQDVKFMFIDGSVVCNYIAWPQSIHVLAAGVLVASPFLVFLASSWAVQHIASQQLQASRGIIPDRAHALKRDVCEGVRSAFVAPYDSSMPWWESVMMVHRLALAFLCTFASESPAIQSLVSTLVCILFLVLHVYRQPLRQPASQALQSVLLLCLSIVSLVKDFWSSGLQYAVPLNPGTIPATIASTNTFCEVVTLLSEYLIPFTALLASYYFS